MIVRVLESLKKQTLNRDLYEVIVVDNASTDATLEVVENFQASHRDCNIILVREDILGLGHARNTGLRYASGAYVAFIDDDAKASADWLETALRCFEEVEPSPIGIGGPILPFYELPKPKWFKDEYEIRTWGKQSRFLKKGESFSGSNMFFRKEIFEMYEGFDVRVGVKGEYLSVGEETALFEKIWELKDDAVFFYSPQLLVFHAVPNYKMTVSYQLKRAFATGQAWYLRHGPKSCRRRWGLVAKTFVRIAKIGASALLHKRKYFFYQNWLTEEFAPIAVEVGRLACCLRLSILVKQR